MARSTSPIGKTLRLKGQKIRIHEVGATIEWECGVPIFTEQAERLIGGKTVIRGGMELMFPFLGQQPHDVPGVSLGQHGFLRDLPVTAFTQAANYIVAHLERPADDSFDWPTKFLIKVEGTGERSFRLLAAVTNEGTSPMPAGFGLHPYFDTGLGKPFSVHADGIRLLDQDDVLANNAFAVPADGLVIRTCHGDIHVTSGLRSFDEVVLWTDQIQTYICAEPRTSPAKFAQPDGIWVDPGQVHSFEYYFEFQST